MGTELARSIGTFLFSYFKETLSLELEDVRVKYVRFQEEAGLVMADLQREKVLIYSGRTSTSTISRQNPSL